MKKAPKTQTLPATQITLNDAQFEAFTSDAKETFLIGGVGMGKSFMLGLNGFQSLLVPEGRFALFAPTYDTLKNATLKQVQECWTSLGFLEEDHYVIGRRPPKNWGVPPFTTLSNNGILTTVWGSYMVLDGLENFNKHRGTAFDKILVDEFRDVRENVREMLIGRLRGKTFTKLGKKHQIFYATTPPDNPRYLLELHRQNLPTVKFVFGSTYANRHNLPEDYISGMEATLDSETFSREVMGQLLISTGNLFAHAFRREKHLAINLYTADEPVYVSFDFNVNPITCIILQINRQKVFIVDEFSLPNAEIYHLCEKVYQKYGGRIREVTGDASGMNRSSLSKLTHYDVIEKELHLPAGRLKVSKSNPLHVKSKVLTNSILEKHPNLKIDERCKLLIQDLEMVRMKNNGEGIDKSDSKIGHLLDCFRYALHAWLPDFIRNRR